MVYFLHFVFWWRLQKKCKPPIHSPYSIRALRMGEKEQDINKEEEEKKGTFRERDNRSPSNCPFGQQWAFSLFFPPLGILPGFFPFTGSPKATGGPTSHSHPSTAGSPGFLRFKPHFFIFYFLSRFLGRSRGFCFPRPHP